MKEILVHELLFILTLFILRHPCTSLVYILQSKPFVVFFNLKVVTHGLKNYFCQHLLL